MNASPPPAATQHVLRFDHWMSDSFARGLAQDPAIALTVVPLASPAPVAWAALARTQGYQITAAKDELPLPYHVGSAFLQRCPQLLWVSSSGAGHDTVDVAACTRAGVLVMNQIGGNASAVAEMALGLMLAVSRRIVESDRQLRRERGFSRESLMGHDIGGKTLGLVGMGHTASRTAALAKAFGMRVLAADPYLAPETIRARGAEPAQLDQLLQQADIVSLHCPRQASTLNLFDAQRFAAMKPGAIFISTARGGVHDEQALAQALASGHLAGAGLDVWQTEPPPLNHPLLALPNVVATYHTAGVSHECRANVGAMAAEQIVGLYRGVQPPRLANPEAWGAFLARYEKVFQKAWGAPSP